MCHKLPPASTALKLFIFYIYFLVFNLLFNVYVHPGVQAHTIAHVWKSENSFMGVRSQAWWQVPLPAKAFFLALNLFLGHVLLPTHVIEKIFSTNLHSGMPALGALGIWGTFSHHGREKMTFGWTAKPVKCSDSEAICITSINASFAWLGLILPPTTGKPGI